MGGGKGSPSTPPPSKYETALGDFTTRLISQTDPLRSELLGLYGSLFGLSPQREMITKPAGFTQEKFWNPSAGEGGEWDFRRVPTGTTSTSGEMKFMPTGNQFDARNLPIFQPLFESFRTAGAGAEKAARENILSNVPRGGAQEALLASTGRDIATQRRLGELGLETDIFNTLFSGAQSAAFGTPNTAVAGYGTAGSQAASRQQAALAAQSQANQGKKNTGTALGLGMMAFNPFAGMGKGAAGTGGTSLAGFVPSSGWAAPTTFFPGF